jgi:hypothetical protein
MPIEQVYFEDSCVEEPHMYCAEVEEGRVARATFYKWDSKAQRFYDGTPVEVTPRIRDFAQQRIDQRSERLARFGG